MNVNVIGKYISAAERSGRAHDFVRRSQLRIYSHRPSTDYSTALIRVWDEMRRAGQPVHQAI